MIRQPRPAPIESRPVVFGHAVVGGVPVLTLDAQNYENLRLNIADSTRWIREVIGRLDYYEEAADKAAE